MSGSTQFLNLAVLSRPMRILLAGWFVATLGLGAWGYHEYALETGADPSFWTALYHAAQLFVLHAPHFEEPVHPALEVARWSAAILFGGTVFQIARQLFPREFAALRSWRLSRHVIIGGLGRRALQCVRCERAKPLGRRRNVVVIDRHPPDDLAVTCARLGAQVLTGDVTDPSVLRAAGLRRAAELWALCGEDSINCETAVQAEHVLAASTRRDGTPVTCNVHLSDIDLRVELQRHAGRAFPNTRLALRFFDLYDFEARRVLLKDLPVDHDGITAGEPRRPHLVVLGFGRMGRSLALRAAKVAHFANAVGVGRRGLRVSVIDRIGAQHESGLLFRYPRFREVCDLEVHALDIESPAARAQLERWCEDRSSLTSIAVCFDDTPRAVEVALRLLPTFRSAPVRVAVRIAHREGIGSMVDRVWDSPEGDGSAPAARISTFGRLDEGCCEDALVETDTERLARAIHADFVTRRLAERLRDPSDRSLADWAALDEDLRESNRQQADHLVIKLRTVGAEAATSSDPRPPIDSFADEQVELLAQMEHARWNAERILAGWTRGERDVARHTTPYLCPWEELPTSIQDYDRTAVRTIPDLLRSIGMKAVTQRELDLLTPRA